MIAFACAVTDVAHFEKFAQPGIQRVAEPDSEIYVQAAPGPNFRIYNLLLDRAQTASDLEALVIVNEKAELLDPQFCAKVRRVLADPEVGVAGCIGATGVRGMAWWEGQVRGRASMYRDIEDVVEGLPSLTSDGWSSNRADSSFDQVDAIDGLLMVLSPWAVDTLRFDEALGPKHGFDVDFCLQVRAAGRKVVTADFDVAHAYPLGIVEDPDSWMEAHLRVAEKWDGRLPGMVSIEASEGAVGDTEALWRARARRAEGEAAAARLLSATRTYQIQALIRYQERELDQLTSGISWRATRPLRQINAAVVRARRRAHP